MNTKFSSAFISLFLLLTFIVNAQNNVELFYAASWNVENLFDLIDAPDKNDEEWLPGNSKDWNEQKLNLKLKNLSKIIRWMNEMEGPDLLGLQEVEHQHLLDSLISRHFCDKNYKIVYEESLDARGIDNALIYNADIFRYVRHNAIHIELDKDYETRYILYAALQHRNNDTIHVFVNHWPSRRGGLEKSEPSRIAAANVLRNMVDALLSDNPLAQIIILGDFNDEPVNISIAKILKAEFYDCNETEDLENPLLLNLSYKLYSEGQGTYKFLDDWNMLDQIIVSASLIKKGTFAFVCDSFEIIKPEIMMTRTGYYKGAARPTYGGKSYLGGFSDHFPVGAKFMFAK